MADKYEIHAQLKSAASLVINRSLTPSEEQKLVTAYEKLSSETARSRAIKSISEGLSINVDTVYLRSSESDNVGREIEDFINMIPADG